MKTSQEQFVDDFWFNTLGWCGCGNPNVVLTQLRDTLQLLHDRSESRHEGKNFWNAGTDKLYVHLELNTDKAWLGYIVLYILDKHGLTEHGSTIAGSWLTPEGLVLLEKLKAVDIEKALE